jgi:hypothetical protein
LALNWSSQSLPAEKQGLQVWIIMSSSIFNFLEGLNCLSYWQHHFTVPWTISRVLILLHPWFLYTLVLFVIAIPNGYEVVCHWSYFILLILACDGEYKCSIIILADRWIHSLNKKQKHRPDHIWLVDPRKIVAMSPTLLGNSWMISLPPSVS